MSTRRRACQPSVNTLEGRVVLSLSLSSLWNSLVSSINGTTTTTTTTPTETPAQIAAHKQAVQAQELKVQERIAQQHELRLERQQEHLHARVK